MDDLFDVKRELLPVAARWKGIGLALRLGYSELNHIKIDYTNCSDRLTRVLTLWLKKAYNTERFGEPSWELLARAVAHPAGGNNPVLAENIAMKYGGILFLKPIIKEEWKSLSSCVLCISSHTEPLFIVTLSFLSPISSYWNTRGRNKNILQKTHFR